MLIRTLHVWIEGENFGNVVVRWVALSLTDGSLQWKTEILFIDKGRKVNGAYFTDSVLRNGILQDIRRMLGDYFVLQQDWARSHTARLTFQYLEEYFSE